MTKSNEQCVACEGRGVNSRGQACGPCEERTQRQHMEQAVKAAKSQKRASVAPERERAPKKRGPRRVQPRATVRELLGDDLRTLSQVFFEHDEVRLPSWSRDEVHRHLDKKGWHEVAWTVDGELVLMRVYRGQRAFCLVDCDTPQGFGVTIRALCGQQILPGSRDYDRWPSPVPPKRRRRRRRVPDQRKTGHSKQQKMRLILTAVRARFSRAQVVIHLGEDDDRLIRKISSEEWPRNATIGFTAFNSQTKDLLEVGTVRLTAGRVVEVQWRQKTEEEELAEAKAELDKAVAEEAKFYKKTKNYYTRYARRNGIKLKKTKDKIEDKIQRWEAGEKVDRWKKAVARHEAAKERLEAAKERYGALLAKSFRAKKQEVNEVVA